MAFNQYLCRPQNCSHFCKDRGSIPGHRNMRFANSTKTVKTTADNKIYTNINIPIPVHALEVQF